MKIIRWRKTRGINKDTDVNMGKLGTVRNPILVNNKAVPHPGGETTGNDQDMDIDTDGDIEEPQHETAGITIIWILYLY